MQKLTQSDLQDIAQYELVRNDYRREIMAHKRPRRVDLGPDVALTFEDGRTMAFQIQEMMRAEQMVTEAAIQGELDVYNDLVPEPGELSATLFIEITDDTRIKELLHRFIGLTDGDKLWLETGGERCFAQFEAGRKEVASGGVVRDQAVIERVIQEIQTFVGEQGWSLRGTEASPIKGPKGNQEYLLVAERD